MAYPEGVDIAGARLVRWDASRHVAAIVRMTRDPGAMEFLQLATDRASAERMSARFAGHWDDHGFGLWALVPDGGPAAGWVGACHPLWHPEFAHRVELAWALTQPARGRGFASAAAGVAVGACFTELGLEELVAFVDDRNARSLAVAARLGMVRTAETADPRTGTPLQVLTLGRP